MNSMAYQKQTWQDNDVITKAKLDHIEDGILNVDNKTLPEATTEVKGVVKQATKVDNVTATDTITISGTNADYEEITKIVTLVKELKTKVNALLEALKTSGQMKNL